MLLRRRHPGNPRGKFHSQAMAARSIDAEPGPTERREPLAHPVVTDMRGISQQFDGLEVGVGQRVFGGHDIDEDRWRTGFQHAARFAQPRLEFVPMVCGKAAGDEVEMAILERQLLGRRDDPLDILEAARRGRTADRIDHRFGQVAGDDVVGVRGKVIADVSATAAEVKRARRPGDLRQCFDPVEILTVRVDLAGDISVSARGKLRPYARIVAGMGFRHGWILSAPAMPGTQTCYNGQHYPVILSTMISEEQRKLLGAFVRARREGMPAPAATGRRRRTPGLRREELAERAGIGVTWVAWIEQGREVRASAETLRRLSRALALTRAERAYLFELAGRRDPDNPFSAPEEEAPHSIVALVAGLAWPAYGLDPAWNICCWNEAARHLFVGLDREPGHTNLLRYVFAEPAARALLPDWQSRAARLLAEFRADYGHTHVDPRARAVVDWLCANSAAFRTLWQEQAVVEREGGTRQFAHPAHGALRFFQHTLRASERPDFKLVVLEPTEASG